MCLWGISLIKTVLEVVVVEVLVVWVEGKHTHEYTHTDAHTPPLKVQLDLPYFFIHVTKVGYANTILSAVFVL